MADIFDFVEQFKNLRFSDMGLCEADNAVFSRLAYLDFSGCAGKTLNEISEEYIKQETEKKTVMETERLLREIGNTKRYGYVAVYNTSEIVSEDRATAFYAATFALDKSTFFIAFRGTDDKIISFYEDAELAYSFPISSQTSALSYVSAALDTLQGDFFLGGHSKGGNLALFAFLFLTDEQKERIIKVYNNDGPGIPKEFVNILFTPKIQHKVISILPEDSIVGRMLELGGEYKIIKSTASGAAQHNMFTWETEGNHFKETGKFSVLSEYMESTLTESLETISPDQIKKTAEMIFSIARESEIRSLKDINAKNYKGMILALIQISKLTEEETGEIPMILKTLVRSLLNSINLEKIITYGLPNILEQIEKKKEKNEENSEE